MNKDLVVIARNALEMAVAQQSLVQWLRPQIASTYENKKMPPLLPGGMD